MSAIQFQRQLGIGRYETAFQILHKLRAGMVRPDRDQIGGWPGEHVEVDETYVGGRRSVPPTKPYVWTTLLAGKHGRQRDNHVVKSSDAAGD